MSCQKDVEYSALDQGSYTARGLTIWFTLFSAAAVFAVLPLTKIHFDFADPLGLFYILVTYVAISLYCWKRHLYRIAPAFEGVGLGALTTVPMLIASYMAASLDLPLQDRALVLADQALGFDWMSFITFIDARPLLSHTLGLAYSSFAFQLVALPVLLSLTGRYQRVYAMILSYVLLSYVTCIVSIWFPALGTYAVYGLAPDQLSNINAHYGFAFLKEFNAVRDQGAFTLLVANAEGIITFPSLHAGGAFLCAWAAWDIKPLRYPMAIWNVLMAVSAISHANHYFVDVIGGISLSAASIYAVSALLRRLNSRQVHIPTPSAVMMRLLAPVAVRPRPSSSL